MSNRVRTALVGGLTLTVAAVIILTVMAPAFAAAPLWEQDLNAQPPYGNIVLYDSAGNVLTGGSDLSHIADFAAATTAGDVGATKANLIFAAPDHTKVTGLWFTQSASASTIFPNASAPAPITGPGFTKPLVTLNGVGDADVNSFLGARTNDPTPGYSNVVQLRLKDSGTGVSSGTHYWTADISVDPTAGTWTLIYPSITSTSTSLSTTPAACGSSGSSVMLNSTVTPAENGSIQFFDGTTPVGTAQAVTTTGPTATATVTPLSGVHNYSAKFTPTGGTTVQGSTSATKTVTISAPNTATSTGLSANPTSAQFSGQITFTAKASEADAPTTCGLAGTVAFKEGATTLGTQNVNDGTAGEYKFSTNALTVGTHTITATFTPANTDYTPSTSAPVTVTVVQTVTKLVADPSVAQILPGAKVFFPKVGATLSGLGGAPLAGRTISFSVGTTFLCSAVTGANGHASCGSVTVGLKAVTGITYKASFAGDTNDTAATATGHLLLVNGKGIV